MAATPVFGCSGTRIIVLRYLVGQQHTERGWEGGKERGEGGGTNVSPDWLVLLFEFGGKSKKTTTRKEGEHEKEKEREREREFKTAHWVDKWRETGCCSWLPAPACCWRSRGTEPTQSAACCSKER